MKKTFIVLAAFAFSLGVSAQETKPQNPTTEDSKPQKQHDHLVMEKGKMMMVSKDGAKSNMKGNMTLRNGAKVNTNGMITMPNSKIVPLYNGDQIDMDGKITKMP